jgi:hypothetical protein
MPLACKAYCDELDICLLYGCMCDQDPERECYCETSKDFHCSSDDEIHQ